MNLTALREWIAAGEYPIWQWVFCVCILLLFIVVSRLYRKKSAAVITRIIKKLKGTFWENLLEALSKQVSLLLLSLGIFIALWNMPLADGFMATLHGILAKAMYILIIGLLAWACCALVDNLPVFQFKFLGSAEAVRRLLKKAVKVLILVFAALAAMEAFGLPVTSLITGLGIGGLVISLAAQDTASNLIAGLVIIIERPFAIGDWISTSQAEGTVEDITFRSTKIRTLANTLAIVPNSVISAEMITNGSERKMRMAEFTIGVCYGTPRSSMEKLCTDFRTLLENDEDIVGDSVVVRLSAFSASSIDILVRYYTKTTQLDIYLEITERINFEIIRIMEEDGVQFAFPSTTVYFGDSRPDEK